MATHIITDSTCDFSREQQEKLNITVVPLSVHINGASYQDGLDLTSEEFYEKAENSEKLPTTSQIPPQAFVDVFEAHIKDGDHVVGIFISSEISGTYQSACIAKESLNSDRIHVIDSRNATMSMGLLIAEAVKHRDAGHSAEEIAEHVTGLIGKVRFFAAINTLKFLRKGGRISATTAVLGEVLGMKPLVSMIGGTIHSIGKARGMTSAIKLMLQKALSDLPDLTYGVIFAHSCAPELLKDAIAVLKEPLKIKDYMVCNIGSVIGTYAGKGAVGFAYIAK